MGLQEVLSTSENYRMLAVNKDNAHHEVAHSLTNRHTWLGVAVVISSVVVSTAIFSTISQSAAVGWKIATGLLSVLAAVLAALQTFFKLSEQAESHLMAASGYSRVRRRLEIFQLRFQGDSHTDDEAISSLDEIRTELDNLESSSPPIPDAVYDRVSRRLKDHRRVFA